MLLKQKGMLLELSADLVGGWGGGGDGGGGLKGGESGLKYTKGTTPYLR